MFLFLKSTTSLAAEALPSIAILEDEAAFLCDVDIELDSTMKPKSSCAIDTLDSCKNSALIVTNDATLHNPLARGRSNSSASSDSADSSNGATHASKRVQIFAIVLTIASAFLAAVWSVIMGYLELERLNWLQIYVLGETSNLIYSLLLWLSYMKWTFSKLVKHSKHPMHLKQPQSSTSSHTSVVSVGSAHTSRVSFCSHIVSIFPSREDRRVWLLLLGRGFCNSLSFQCYVISLIYLDSGDSMLLRTTLTSFGVFIVSALNFGERVTKLVLVAFLLAIVGLVLICHPSFIYGAGAGISVAGALFASLSALFRVGSKFLIKRSGKLNVHWMVMNIATFTITCSVGAFEVIAFLLYYAIFIESSDSSPTGSNNGSSGTIGARVSYRGVGWIDKHLWYNWFVGDAGHAGVITLFVLMYGIIFVGKVSCTVVGHQVGDIGRLGIIANSDIVFTYLLGALLLQQMEPAMTYIGAVLVVAGVCVLCLEQMARKASKSQKQAVMQKVENKDKDDAGTYANKVS